MDFFWEGIKKLFNRVFNYKYQLVKRGSQYPENENLF